MATGFQLVLIVLAGLAALPFGAGVSATGASCHVLIGLLAIAIGMQNDVVRKLAVPDLTTTVLTLTTTGIFADAKIFGGPGSKVGRRTISLIAIFLGALVGAVLDLKISVWVALVPAAAILAVFTVATALPGRGDLAWTRAVAP